MEIIAAGLVLLLLIAVVAGFIWSRRKRRLKDRRRGGGQRSYPSFRLQSELLSAQERALLERIEQDLAGRARVLVKVRTSSVLTPLDSTELEQNARALQYFGQRKFDFLICHGPQLQPIVAIDGSMREADAERRRNGLLGHACRSAGLPLIRIDASNPQAVLGLNAQLAPYLSQLPMPAAQSAPAHWR